MGTERSEMLQQPCIQYEHFSYFLGSLCVNFIQHVTKAPQKGQLVM